MGSARLAKIDDPRHTPPQRERWQDESLCAQISPELFFPKLGANILDAKLICGSCEVKMRCLKYALDYEAEPDVDGRYGVFGGLSPNERKKLVKMREEDPSIALETAYDAVISLRKQKGNRKQNRPVAKAA